MLRLAHRILTSKAQIPIEYTSWIESRAKPCGKICLDAVRSKMSPIVIADDVWEFMKRDFKHNIQKWLPKGDELTSLFPNLAPPFREFFIEATITTEPLDQRGWAVLATDSELGNEGGKLQPELAQKAKWQIYLTPCASTIEGRWGPTLDVVILYVDKDGCLLGSAMIEGQCCRSVTDDPLTDDPVTDALMAHKIALLTISLMNCRNVMTTDITENVGPSRKWLKRQRQPQLQYSTVTIDPSKPRRSHSHDCEGIPTQKRPHHICRGHFRTYTPEDGNGLFGRGQFGTFWVPSHERGNKKHGQTITTYNVKGPTHD